MQGDAAAPSRTDLAGLGAMRALSDAVGSTSKYPPIGDLVIRAGPPTGPERDVMGASGEWAWVGHDGTDRPGLGASSGRVLWQWPILGKSGAGEHWQSCASTGLRWRPVAAARVIRDGQIRPVVGRSEARKAGRSSLGPAGGGAGLQAMVAEGVLDALGPWVSDALIDGQCPPQVRACDTCVLVRQPGSSQEPL